jgi:hypothetical protein
MFSALRSRFLRSFAVRLSLWYATLFTCSAALLFGLLYVLLGSALDRKDHEVVETRLKAYAAVYDNGGLSALQDFVQRTLATENNREFFIRVEGQSGTVLLLNVPENWVQFDASALQPDSDLSNLFWLRIPKDDERDLTIASLRLADGSALEVGRVAGNR